MIRFVLAMFVTLAAVTAFGAFADGPTFLYPQIAGYGGIVPIAKAAEPPRAGVKVIFDIVASGKPEEVNKGLESVARYLNLQAAAGIKPANSSLALVLHGGAIHTALDHAAYARHLGVAENPNLALIKALCAHGVEVFVCGQSLARSKYNVADVASDLTIAASAMTVNVNKQQDGYAYLSIH